MQSNVIQCKAIQFNAMQCIIIQSNAIQFNVMQYNVIQSNAIQWLSHLSNPTFLVMYLWDFLWLSLHLFSTL